MTRSTSGFGLALAALLLMLCGHDAAAQGKTKPQVRTTPVSGPTEADNTGAYTVIQSGSELKIVREGAIDKLKKQAEDNYKADLKSWQAQKDAAAREHEPYTMKPPVKNDIKILKGGFKTGEEAEKFRAAKLEELNKNKKKEPPAPAGKG